LKVSFAIFHFALIFYCVYFLSKKWSIRSEKLFWSAFLVRGVSGISLGLVYTHYYPAGDTWSFFNDAKIFSAYAHDHFFSYVKMIVGFGESQSIVNELNNHDLRSIFFIKIISVFCLLSFDNYWVCAAYFSLLSFIGAWLLHRKITDIFSNSHHASVVAFLFFPSVVFWSSGLEKESIALCGIYFLTSGFLSLIFSKKSVKLFWLLVIPVCYIVWELKYYWTVVFFISIFTALMLRFLMTRSSVIERHLNTAWFVLFSVIGVLLSFTNFNFHLDRFPEVIASSYNDLAAISDPKNLIHYFQLNQSWTSLIINAPWALLSGLFRPVIGEGRGLFGIIASIENFFMLTFSVAALLNLRKAFHSSHQIILLTALSYCIVLCVFLALSTPNFGTLSRYRVGFLPFFVFVIAYRNPIIEWLFNKAKTTSASISIFEKKST
jgi:hypothetical protein